MSTHTLPENDLDDRLIERCEDVPADPEPGNYVVIDVLHFSNTVIELLRGGASWVHVTEKRGDEFAYRREHPSTVIGGERTGAFEPDAGYDFFNSPSYVQRLDVEGNPASLWSSNGGRAVADLRSRGRSDIDVFVGSTTNARALGSFLRDTGRPTHLVAAGSRGTAAVEDVVGATLISRYMDGIEPVQTELELFRRQVQTAKGNDYVEKHPIRRRDVLEYAANINGRGTIPKLVEGVLVDYGTTKDRALLEAAAVN